MPFTIFMETNFQLAADIAHSYYFAGIEKGRNYMELCCNAAAVAVARGNQTDLPLQWQRTTTLHSASEGCRGRRESLTTLMGFHSDSSLGCLRATKWRASLWT